MLVISNVNFRKKDNVVSDKCLVFTVTQGGSLPGLEGKSYSYTAPKSKYKTLEQFRKENVGRKLPYETIEELCAKTGYEVHNYWLYDTEWLNENPQVRKDLIAKAKAKEEAKAKAKEESDDLPF
tara:strand:- start:210 stop:581 length:372 start_codon:yes stop_codon:yes gene_type:complete